ncbi:hypothetical protein [Streptomyces sp. NPDC088816]|uniref:hypothetical protein n=1 Tax=unclassified Streptomyces TaxID=2593676 RepID=UPI00382D810B
MVTSVHIHRHPVGRMSLSGDGRGSRCTYRAPENSAAKRTSPELFETAARALGGIDVLVDNAGISGPTGGGAGS